MACICKCGRPIDCDSIMCPLCEADAENEVDGLVDGYPVEMEGEDE